MDNERNTFKEILPLPSSHAPPPRSARLPAFVGMQAGAAAALDKCALLFVATGSVGGMAALQFCRQQPGAVYLADRCRCKTESLLTHAFFYPEHVERPKASSVAQLCRAISPATRVFAFDGDVQSIPKSVYGKVDAVILASDNLTAEVEVGQWCRYWGKPLIQAAVHGETLVTQARFFSNASSEAVCPRCSFNATERAAVDQELIFSCAGHAIQPEPRQTAVVPTMSTSFLCSMAAELAMMLVYRHVLKLGKPLTDSLFEYCGYSHRATVSPLNPNPACACDHQPWRQANPPRARVADCTLRELAEAADSAAGSPISFTVGDALFFVEWAICRCGRRERVRRFCPEGRSTGNCHDCGEPMFADPHHVHRPVALGVLQPVLDQPLHALGATDADWVLVRGNEPVVFRNQNKGVML